jgi:hypothetical protein
MATLANVSLDVQTNGQGSAEITVKGAMKLTTEDVGKTYFFSIALRASDPPGDAPPFDPIGDEVLHTFMFGEPPFQQAHKKIVVTQAGTIAFTEKRPVRVNKLNEDKGNGWRK